MSSAHPRRLELWPLIERALRLFEEMEATGWIEEAQRAHSDASAWLMVMNTGWSRSSPAATSSAGGLVGDLDGSLW